MIKYHPNVTVVIIKSRFAGSVNKIGNEIKTYSNQILIYTKNMVIVY